MNELETQNLQYRTATTLVEYVFQGNQTKALNWMFTENGLLGGIEPAKMIKLGRGEKLLRWMICQIAENFGPETLEQAKDTGSEPVKTT